MNILLIDTSTRTARVGIIEDEKLLDSKEWESTPELGKQLLEEIDGLLKKHKLIWKDVARVAVHRGRVGSSFMGLRTGIVTATMLAEGSGLELVSVEAEDLDTMVKEACQGRALSVIDPRYVEN